MIDYDNVTCDARDLANLFDMTPRNVLHMVDRGMPVYEMGKAGKGHVFKVPWALNWWGGWRACKHWDKTLPGTLETFLIGSGLAWSGPECRFKEWMRHAKKTASEMGYSETAFDAALKYVISKGLLRL